MKISVKAFITAKSEYDSITKCMDSFSIEPNKGIFAVSDGVSGSLMAKLWAPLLTKTYLKNAATFFDNDESGSIILNPNIDLPNQFNKELENYMMSLSDDKRERIQGQIERFAATGGSRGTFIGLQIVGNYAKLETIGDSITYTYFDDEIKHCTSMEENGEIQFTQTPQCIASNGKIYGSVKTVNIPLQNGYIYMMTDGIAKWFYNPEKYSDNIKKINSIRDHKEFYSFVETQRTNLSMDDDDTTLIVIKIEDVDKEGITVENLYVDNVDSIELEELRIKTQKLESDNDQMNEKIQDLTKENERIKKENSSLKDKLSSVKQDFNGLNTLLLKINKSLNEKTI